MKEYEENIDVDRVAYLAPEKVSHSIVNDTNIMTSVYCGLHTFAPCARINNTSAPGGESWNYCARIGKCILLLPAPKFPFEKIITSVNLHSCVSTNTLCVFNFFDSLQKTSREAEQLSQF